MAREMRFDSAKPTTTPGVQMCTMCVMTHRLHANVTDKAWDDITHLVQQHGDPITSVVQRSVAIARYLADQQEAGATLRIVAADGTATSMRVFT